VTILVALITDFLLMPALLSIVYERSRNKIAAAREAIS